jgi:cytochrome P450
MSSGELDRQETTGCPAAGGPGFSLAEATLADPKLRAHPNEFYRALRTEDPVHYDPELSMYLVSRYEDLQTVLRDPITFSIEKGFEAQRAKGFVDEFYELVALQGRRLLPNLIMKDPPEHARIRRLTEQAFTAHRVKDLEPRIAAIAVDLIEQMSATGRCDGIKDFAVAFTIRVICEQLGFSQFDADKIQRWTHATTAQIGRGLAREEMLGLVNDYCELQDYVEAHVRARQLEPREDMISDLVRARLEDGTALTFEEIAALVSPLLVAGNETTATAIGNLLYILATQPQVHKELAEAADDDRLLSRFVEELLRIEAPVRGLARMTTQEVELGGTLLPAGAHLLLLFGSGNDDETEFPCPRSFDMTRGNLGRQLAFGAGIHRCIGAALARMEIKVAAREIVRRLDNLELAIAPEEIAYLPTIATRSIASLPLTFTRRPEPRA